MGKLMVLLTLGAAGAAAMYWANKHAPGQAPVKVRDAGPANMRHPPRSWGVVEEQSDESFPASDPPGNY